MKKKGFTLTEVLVVIVIIGVLLAIAIPSIAIVRKNINNRVYESKEDLILAAALTYGKDFNITRNTTVKVYELLKENLIEADLKAGESICTKEVGINAYGCVINPVDNTNMNNQEIYVTYNRGIVESRFKREGEYQISFVINNGSALKSAMYVSENESASLAVTPDSGYTLEGATVRCEEATASINESTGIVTVSNVRQAQTCSVTLLPTYTITMNVSGGTSNLASKSIVSGGTDTFEITPSSNYTLTGATVSCEEATASINESTGIVTVSNVTQAQTCSVVLPSTLPIYIVTFDTNGGNAWTSATCTLPSVLSSGTCTKEVVSTQTYGTLPTPTRSNYTFDGWYTNHKSGTLVTDTSTVSISANQTLYARWTAYPIVALSVRNGTVSPSSSYVHVTPGGSTSFTVTPNSGYTLTNATVSCGQATASVDTTQNTITISNVTESQTCTVTLGRKYTITYSSFSSAGVSPTAGDQPTEIISGGSTSFTFSAISGVGNLYCSANRISCTNAMCAATTTTCQNSRGQNKTCKQVTISNPTKNVTVTCTSLGNVY